MTIEALFKVLADVQNSARKEQSEIQEKIQQELNHVFDDWQGLHKAIACLESGDGVYYQGDECGNVIMSLQFGELSNMDKRHKEYLEYYLSDRGIYVNFDADTLELNQGDDCIVIQDEHGRDNGVYQGHKLIIHPDHYCDEATGEVNRELRNQLIEAHMKKTGYYPCVFRVTYHGDFYPVNTRS